MQVAMVELSQQHGHKLAVSAPGTVRLSSWGPTYWLTMLVVLNVKRSSGTIGNRECDATLLCKCDSSVTLHVSMEWQLTKVSGY